MRGCADGPPSAAEWPLLLFSLTERVQKSAFRRGGMRDYKSERFVETEGPIHGFSDFLHIWKEPHGRPFRRDETLTFGFRKAFKNSKSKHSVSTDRSLLKMCELLQKTQEWQFYCRGRSRFQKMAGLSDSFPTSENGRLVEAKRPFSDHLPKCLVLAKIVRIAILLERESNFRKSLPRGFQEGVQEGNPR